jgi:hypothetical protein
MPAGAPASAPEFRKMPNVRLHNWMEALKPDKKLVDLWLPGSHDSGVYMDKEKGLDPSSSACCQSGNIGKQADVGSRVFDIRCFMDGNTPKMGHFFMDIAPLGSYGGTLESALDDAGVFLTANNTEFLIFRIGHTECIQEVAAVLEKFRIADTSEKFHNPKYRKTGNNNASLFHRSTTGSILVDQEVRQLKGKLVLLCDNENLQSANFKPGKGYYLYDKYSTSPSNAQIRFCGKYGGSPVKTSTKGKGNWSADGAVNNAEEAFLEHQTHCANKPKPDHLWWVYWQQTGGNVKEKTSAMTGMHNRLEIFLSKFRTGNLPHPNIIGQDFVEKVTCGAIVKMNEIPNFRQDWKLDTYGF